MSVSGVGAAEALDVPAAAAELSFPWRGFMMILAPEGFIFV